MSERGGVQEGNENTNSAGSFNLGYFKRADGVERGENNENQFALANEDRYNGSVNLSR